MSLIARILNKHDIEVRAEERDRLIALANGDIKGCSGLDCEECERITLLDDLAKFEEWRIIKLLDEALVYDEPVVIERDRLIELIKGEQKCK